MGVIVEEDFKRWTAKSKAALVTEILQGRTLVSEAARSSDLSPSEVEDWVPGATLPSKAQEPQVPRVNDVEVAGNQYSRSWHQNTDLTIMRNFIGKRV